MGLLKWTGILVTGFGLGWTLLARLVPSEGEPAVAGGALIIVAFGLFLVIASLFAE
ncbi:MAG: hypothetical protein SVU88_01890 [Candidatus Nanohaloarchaea archaeon]|nr:hypothetical protein [Candidatus Nanohaloarchaea archaeon]